MGIVRRLIRVVGTLPSVLRATSLGILMASSGALSAGPIVGGYITYDCMGNGLFRISFHLYHSCGNPLPPTSANVVVRDSTGLILDNVFMFKVGEDTINTATIFDPCVSGPSGLCVKEVRYQTVYGPPFGKGQLMFTWSGSSRNTPLENTSTSGASFSATMPDSTVGCNNAPMFPTFPPMYLCVSDSLDFDHSAYDADGDSLVYYLCDNMNSISVWPPKAVTYTGSYSGSYPMNSIPPVSIDALTGKIVGRPQVKGSHVVAICIDEYRNGVKIGEYRREFQFIVIDCIAPIAWISGTGVKNYDTLKLCSSFAKTFSNWSTTGSFHWSFGTGNPADTSTGKTPTFTFPDTGMYVVRLIVGPNTSCADTAYVVVAVYPITSVAMNWTTWPCLGEPIQFVGSSWPAYSGYSWYWNFNNDGTSTQQNPTFTWNTPGIKNIWLTATFGACSKSTWDYLYMLQLPSLSVGPDQLICTGDSAQLSAVGTGTFTWTPATGLSDPNIPNPKASPPVTTVYTVRLTSGGVPCENVTNVTVTVVDPPVVSAGADVTLCANEPYQLNATAFDTAGIASWSWAPPAGLSQTNTPDPIATYPATLTYTVTATNVHGCEGSDLIKINRLNPTVNAGQDAAICTGDSVQLTASTFASPLTWSWSPAGLLNDPTIPNPVAKPTVTTAFVITMMDNVNCTATDTVVVTVNPLPPVDAGADTAICMGDTLQLAPSGASIYQWDPNPNLSCSFCQNPIVQNATSNSWYYLAGTDANGCSNRDSIFVVINPLPIVTVTNDTFVCAGESIQLKATAPPLSVYQWTGPPGLFCWTCSDPIATPVQTSTWTVTATDNNSCSSDASVMVEVKPLPNIIITGNTTICETDYTALAASGAISYYWQPGGMSTPSVSVAPVTNTTFTVTGTDGFGCASDAYATIIVHPLPPVDAGLDEAICSGSGTIISASGALTYLWQPGGMIGASQTVSPTVTTTYAVTGTDGNGCSYTDDVTITVHPLPTVTATASSNDICAGDVITLSTGGALTYVWTPGGPGTTLIVAPQTSTTFIVTGTDSNGCNNTTSIFITVRPLPPVSAGPDIDICTGESTTLAASGAVSYLWLPDSVASVTLSVAPTVTASYVVQGTDGYGCVGFDAITVIVHEFPNVSAGPDRTICLGGSVVMTATGASTYAWSTGATTSFIKESPSTSTGYIVVGTDVWGCSASSSVMVTVNPLPVVQIEPVSVICPGETALLKASGAQSYAWFPMMVMGDIVSVNPTQTSSYTVLGTDLNGCASNATRSVPVHPLSPVYAGADQAICEGATAQLSASGGISYVWHSDEIADPTVPDPAVSPQQTTTYVLSGIDINGCEGSDAMTITVNPLPDIRACEDKIVAEGYCVQLSVNGGRTYIWTPGASLDNPNSAVPVACPVEHTTYYVVGTDRNGCEATDSVTVGVFILPVIPTGFTPNGDGLNDVFKIVYNENYIPSRMSIFNRWGQLVFSTNDVGNGWDGKAHGAAQPIGAYVYLIEGTDPEGNLIRNQGNVTLLR